MASQIKKVLVICVHRSKQKGIMFRMVPDQFFSTLIIVQKKSQKSGGWTKTKRKTLDDLQEILIIPLHEQVVIFLHIIDASFYEQYIIMCVVKLENNFTRLSQNTLLNIKISFTNKKFKFLSSPFP